MENFEQTLQHSLEVKRMQLDKDVSPKLKEMFGQIHLFYQNFYNILINKGAVKPDLYHNDQKVTEIVLPSSEPFPESNRANQMSIRLSELYALYDYLYMFIDVSANGLAIKQLKQITEVLRYIEWDKFNLSTEHYMTQSLAIIVSQTRADGVTDRLLIDVAKQLASCTRQSLLWLKELTFYQKEYYKQNLRERFFGSLKFDASGNYTKALEHFITELRKAVLKAGHMPFYRELATEAIEEIYSPEAEAKQEAALNNIKIAEVKKVEPKKKEVVKRNYKEPLFFAFFELGRAAAPLDTMVNKLKANNDLHLKHDLSFGEKLGLTLRRFLGSNTAIIYKTEFTDAANGKVFREEINFDQFIDKLSERSRYLNRFADNGSPVYKKLNEMKDSQAEDLLAKQMTETRLLLTQCSALDDFFKKKTSVQIRDEIKGLKIEITSVKRQLSRAMELRHEYVTEKESSDGMKNLGLS